MKYWVELNWHDTLKQYIHKVWFKIVSPSQWYLCSFVIQGFYHSMYINSFSSLLIYLFALYYDYIAQLWFSLTISIVWYCLNLRSSNGPCLIDSHSVHSDGFNLIIAWNKN